EASQVTAVGPTVDMSTTVSGGRAPAAIPCGPSGTERSACGALSMVVSTSARLPPPPGVAATPAPRPASRPALPGGPFPPLTPGRGRPAAGPQGGPPGPPAPPPRPHSPATAGVRRGGVWKQPAGGHSGSERSAP